MTTCHTDTAALFLVVGHEDNSAKIRLVRSISIYQYRAQKPSVLLVQAGSIFRLCSGVVGEVLQFKQQFANLNKSLKVHLGPICLLHCLVQQRLGFVECYIRPHSISSSSRDHTQSLYDCLMRL